MTFPVVEATSSGASSTSTTSHNVTLPATVNAGDLLIGRIAWRNGVDLSWDNVSVGPWSELYTSPVINGFRVATFTRVADGSEDGAVLSISLSGNSHVAWHVDRVSGAGAIEAGVAVTGSGATANPPNLAPSWGADDVLWITVVGQRTAGAAADPTNYSGQVDASSAGGTGGVALHSSYRQLNASSENPSSWDISSSAPNYAVNTFAVRAGKTLALPRLDVGVTFYTPSVVSILKPPLMSVGIQFLAPAVGSKQVLQPPLLAVNLEFFSPFVGGGLLATRLDVGVTFFPPTVLEPGKVKPPRLDIGVKFFKPLVEGGFRSVPQFTSLSFGPFPGAISDAALYDNTFNAPLRFEDRWAVRGPLGFTDFAPFVASMYEFEAAFVWLKLTLDEPASPVIAITQARVHIDVPDQRDSGEADIPEDGAFVLFTRAFNAPPDVVAQVITAVGVTEAPKVTVREDITSTQFFAVCHTGDDTGASVAARIKWVAQGF